MITITNHDINAWEVTVNCDEGHLTITHTRESDEVEVTLLHPGKTITLERINEVLMFARYHVELHLAKVCGTVSEAGVPF